jgi:hypothetical protein
MVDSRVTFLAVGKVEMRVVEKDLKKVDKKVANWVVM